MLSAAYYIVNRAIYLNIWKMSQKSNNNVRQFIWAALGIVYVIFIVAMQLYCFWKM